MQGPLGTIQAIFYGKPITAKCIDLRRGRPRCPSSDDMKDPLSARNEFPYEKESECDAPEPPKLVMPSLSRIASVDSADSSQRVRLPSVRGDSFERLSGDSRLPSVRGDLFERLSGDSFERLSDSSTSGYVPGMPYPLHNLSGIGEELGLLPHSQLSNGQYSTISSSGLFDHNPHSSRPFRDDESMVNIKSAHARPAVDTETESLSTTGHSDSSCTFRTAQSSFSETANEGATNDFVRFGFSAPDRRIVLAYPHGSAQGRVVGVAPDRHPLLNVRIMANQSQFEGPELCSMVFTGNQASIKEIISIPVVVAFHVGAAHSLIVSGTPIDKCSSPTTAISSIMVPSLEQLFPHVNIEANSTATASVEICLKLYQHGVLQFASSSLQVDYIWSKTLPAAPTQSINTAGGKKWEHSEIRNSPIVSTM